MAQGKMGTRVRALRSTLGPRLHAGFAAGLLLAGCAEAPTARRVVLVSIDTLRADHVGCYGARRAHTPTLDSLAATGVRFATAISPTPLTLPSHTSLLTGLTPPRHGVRNNSTFEVPGDVETLATRLAGDDFATAAFVGAIVLDRQYGLARSFDHYDDQMAPRKASGEHGFAERRADAVVDSAIEWLATAPDEFLVWVHLYDPHANYDPPAGFRAAFPSDPYAGEIAFADSEAGRLLEFVDERYLDGLTLVVATSDHGEALGEHGEYTHSLSIYEATQRVPLLMRGPGVPAGRVVEAPVGLVDVFPTVLALLGRALPEGLDGRDLRPLLEEDATDDGRALYVETVAPQTDFGWSPLLGVRERRWKYIRAPRPELYDLDADPAELENRADDEPEELARLDALVGSVTAASRPTSRRRDPSEAERSQLEELGYVVARGASQDTELGRVGGLDPKDGLPSVGVLLQALELMARGRPETALQALEQLDEGAGGWAFAGYRTLAALDAGLYERAEIHAREAVAGEPGLPANWVALGEALEGQGRLDEAGEAFEEALRRDTANAAPLVGLGRLEELRGRSTQAAALYARASELRGASAESFWRHAALRLEAGEDAAALLERVPVKTLLTPEPALRLARAEARAGQPEAARGRLEAAVAQAKRFQRAELEAAIVELDAGRLP